MALEDFIHANLHQAGGLTRETLDAAMAAVAKQGAWVRHDCAHDGHVVALMTTRCIYCREEVRALTPDENHIRYGEFW